MARILERGDIFFFYRPRVEEDVVKGLDDVQRFYIVLHARDLNLFRLLVLGRKRLPAIEGRKEREWGFVDLVTRDASEIKAALQARTYLTRTRGERVLAPARPAGEGVYAIVRHKDHTHLAHVLELPAQPGEVQHDLRIEPEASYILSVRNPDATAPPGFGLSASRRPDFPEELRERFGRRRFIPADPPDLLNYEGAEVLLIGADVDVRGELSIDLDREQETVETAQIFADLHLDRSNRPLEPLVKGEWR
jgi:hypothetical protein